MPTYVSDCFRGDLQGLLDGLFVIYFKYLSKCVNNDRHKNNHLLSFISFVFFPFFLLFLLTHWKMRGKKHTLV